jgi:hypothetical protein
MRVPVDGGDELPVLEDIGGWTWDIAATGVVFLRFENPGYTVNLLRFPDNKFVQLGSLPFQPARIAVGWAVSPDGRWLLTNEVDRRESDLMVVNNFR